MAYYDGEEEDEGMYDDRFGGDEGHIMDDSLEDDSFTHYPNNKSSSDNRRGGGRGRTQEQQNGRRRDDRGGRGGGGRRGGGRGGGGGGGGGEDGGRSGGDKPAFDWSAFGQVRELEEQHAEQTLELDTLRRENAKLKAKVEDLAEKAARKFNASTASSAGMESGQGGGGGGGGGEYDMRDAKIVKLTKAKRSLTVALERERTRSAALQKQLDAAGPAFEFALSHLPPVRSNEFRQLVGGEMAEDGGGGFGGGTGGGGGGKAHSPGKRKKAAPHPESVEGREVAKQLSRAQTRNREYRLTIEQLKTELKATQRALVREVGDGVPLEEVLVDGTGWRGRAETISLLSDKVRKLKKQLAVGVNYMDQTSGPTATTSFDERHASVIRNMEESKVDQIMRLESALQMQTAHIEDLTLKLKGKASRTTALEKDMKALREKSKVLLSKTQNDDELIQALQAKLSQAQAALEAKPRKYGPSASSRSPFLTEVPNGGGSTNRSSRHGGGGRKSQATPRRLRPLSGPPGRASSVSARARAANDASYRRRASEAGLDGMDTKFGQEAEARISELQQLLDESADQIDVQEAIILKLRGEVAELSKTIESQRTLVKDLEAEAKEAKHDAENARADARAAAMANLANNRGGRGEGDDAGERRKKDKRKDGGGGGGGVLGLLKHPELLDVVELKLNLEALAAENDELARLVDAMRGDLEDAHRQLLKSDSVRASLSSKLDAASEALASRRAREPPPSQLMEDLDDTRVKLQLALDTNNALKRTYANQVQSKDDELSMYHRLLNETRSSFSAALGELRDQINHEVEVLRSKSGGGGDGGRYRGGRRRRADGE